MDESWRMRMGSIPTSNLPNYRHRRSTSSTTYQRREEPISSADERLSPEDFSDVFGGPPRTVLSRQFSNDSKVPSSRCSFYEDIFRPSETQKPERRGRSLPEFRIPGQAMRKRSTGDGFYCSDHRRESCDYKVMRSRPRSKASSSSVLSSEELSPMRSMMCDEDDDDDGGDNHVSSFVSKLRPINVRSKRNSTLTTADNDYDKCQRNTPSYMGNHLSDDIEKHMINENLKYGFDLTPKLASPETISLEPKSNGSLKMSADDLELKLDHSSSSASSVCETDKNEILSQRAFSEQEEDEVESSYVIEINSYVKEGSCESNDIDEAIAWAKESYQRSCSETTTRGPLTSEKEIPPATEYLNGRRSSEGFADSLGLSDRKQNSKEETGKLDIETQIEMRMLDENIRLWSTGKEADIRLLLSSLHHILWPDSGWSPISIASLIDVSKVRKAYQKARLCLHPDKLQQRGATCSQKYIADKAFSILQDAWAAFISQNMNCS